MKIFITSFILLTGLLLKAQVKIENINFKFQNYKILVNYDLSGDGIYLADLYYTKDNGVNWHGPLNYINGDIYGLTSGKGKIINYYILQDHSWFAADSLQFKIVLTPCTGTFIDLRDSTQYKWTRIGRQTWMAENLKAIKYPDGKPIPIVKSNNAWNNLYNSDEACCWYKNDSSCYNKYGVLYTWAAATNLQGFSKSNPSGIQGVCPNGWHLPSEAEWKELEKNIFKIKDIYLKVVHKSSEYYVGKYLKSKNGWKDKGYSSDDFNFSALPGGSRLDNGYFIYESKESYWYSTTQSFGEYIKCFKLSYDDDRFENSFEHWKSGLYVRCLKD